MTSKTREKYPLSEKKIIKKVIVADIGWVVFVLFACIGVVAMLVSTGLPNLSVYALWVLGAGAGLIVVETGFQWWYQNWYFKEYFYDFTDDYVVIRKGTITPREITIPYERVQDVYVDQDIFDRLFGLFDVHLSSATISSGVEAHIDGVERAAADGLRTSLLETVSAKLGKKKHE